MSKWQPIETAPKDGTHFFATGWEKAPSELFLGHWWVGVARKSGNTLELENRNINKSAITHWMPLPKPPAKPSTDERT